MAERDRATGQRLLRHVGTPVVTSCDLLAETHMTSDVRGPALLSLGSINVDVQFRIQHWPDAGDSVDARASVRFAAEEQSIGRFSHTGSERGPY